MISIRGIRARKHSLSQCAAACLMLLAVVSASAATLPSHEHVALPVDDTLTLSAAIDIAYGRYPATVEIQARTEQADAWTDRGDSWLAGRPSLKQR